MAITSATPTQATRPKEFPTSCPARRGRLAVDAEEVNKSVPESNIQRRFDAWEWLHIEEEGTQRQDHMSVGNESRQSRSFRIDLARVRHQKADTTRQIHLQCKRHIFDLNMFSRTSPLQSTTNYSQILSIIIFSLHIIVSTPHFRMLITQRRP